MVTDKALKEFLSERGFHVLSEVSNLLEALASDVPGVRAVMLRGPPGVGKTQLTALFSEWWGAKYIFLQCYPGTGEEELLYKLLPSEETKSGIKMILGPLPRALLLSREGRVVLTIDEFDKTRPQADALLLDFLQNCRLNLYIDDKEVTIAGEPRNLVVFFTSNDQRELTEPLLRRIITINLAPLPPEQVYILLLHHFPQHIAVLLTQIYDDTLQAGLRKPATIQELILAGKLLEQGVDLNTVIKTTVIKYEDDYLAYLNHIRRRTPYKFVKKQEDEEKDELTEYYQPKEIVIPAVSAVSESHNKDHNKDKTSGLLEALRLSVRPRVLEAQPAEGPEKPEVGLIMPDKDFDAYTTIIKVLKPEPTEAPTRFGPFEYIIDGEVRAIISREPLPLATAFTLVTAEKIRELEMSYVGEIYANYKDLLETLLQVATKIKYYTTDRAFIQYNDDDDEELVEKMLIERVPGVANVVKVYGYLKKTVGYKKPPLLSMLSPEREKILEWLMKENVANAEEPVTLPLQSGEFKFSLSKRELLYLLKSLQRTGRKVEVEIISIWGSRSVRVRIDSDRIKVDVCEDLISPHPFQKHARIDINEFIAFLESFSGEG